MEFSTFSSFVKIYIKDYCQIQGNFVTLMLLQGYMVSQFHWMQLFKQKRFNKA